MNELKRQLETEPIIFWLNNGQMNEWRMYSDSVLTDSMKTTVIQIQATQLWQLAHDAVHIHDDASDRISGHVQVVQSRNAGE